MSHRPILSLERRDGRASQNLLAPIFTLPIEIILEIFLHIRDTPALLPPSVKISHICNAWRVLILACPEFWSSIHLPHHPELVKTLLMRSQGALLHVQASYTHEVFGPRLLRPALGLLLKVLKELPRIEALSISAPAAILERAAACMAGSAPRLRKLCLTAIDAPVAAVGTLPEAIRHELTTTLTVLRIHYWPVALGFAMPRSLRRLDITTPYGTAPHLEDLLQCLVQLPQLETFVLVKRGVGETYPLPRVSVPPAHIIAPSLPPFLTMHHLATIYVVAEPTYCANLLCHLHAPKLMSGSLMCADRPDGLPDLVELLRSNWANLGTVESIILEGVSMDMMHMQLEWPTRTVLKVLYWQVLQPRDILAPTLQWRAIYAQLEGVQRIIVCGPITQAIWHMVCALRYGRFPKLRAMRLQRLSLMAPVPGDTQGTIPVRSIDALTFLLNKRRANLRGLQELHFDGCIGIDDEQVRGLAVLADTVFWDGAKLVANSDDLGGVEGLSGCDPFCWSVEVNKHT